MYQVIQGWHCSEIVLRLGPSSEFPGPPKTPAVAATVLRYIAHPEGIPRIPRATETTTTKRCCHMYSEASERIPGQNTVCFCSYF